MATEKQLRIAQRLLDCRRLARRLARSERDYNKLVLEWMEAVDNVAQGESVDHFEAGMKLAAMLQEGPPTVQAGALWAFAATVELVEPDDNSPKFVKATP